MPARTQPPTILTVLTQVWIELYMMSSNQLRATIASHAAFNDREVTYIGPSMASNNI